MPQHVRHGGGDPNPNAMHTPPRLFGITGDPVLQRGLNRIRRAGLLAPAAVEEKPQGVEEGRIRETAAGDDVEVAAAEEDAVAASLGVEPAREVEGGFDEEKLAVGVPDAEGSGRERGGDAEEEERGEPFVF